MRLSVRKNQEVGLINYGNKNYSVPSFLTNLLSTASNKF
jgi:hypothetical protein